MSTNVTGVPRPDGRLLLRAPHGWTAGSAAAAADLARRRRLPALAHVPEQAQAQRAALVAAGFTEIRREAVVAISIGQALGALAGAELPAGVRLLSAAEVDEERLRLLDDELRQDVPGTSGWRSTPQEFHEHTFADPAFDPRTYLVAVDDETGEQIGLVRIWMNERGPRLGLLGVTPERRRCGIGSALLARALEAVRATGATEVTTEYDLTNEGAAVLAARLGARRLGSTIELLYEPQVVQRVPLPVEEHSHAG